MADTAWHPARQAASCCTHHSQCTSVKALPSCCSSNSLLWSVLLTLGWCACGARICSCCGASSSPERCTSAAHRCKTHTKSSVSNRLQHACCLAKYCRMLASQGSCTRALYTAAHTQHLLHSKPWGMHVDSTHAALHACSPCAATLCSPPCQHPTQCARLVCAKQRKRQQHQKK